MNMDAKTVRNSFVNLAAHTRLNDLHRCLIHTPSHCEALHLNTLQNAIYIQCTKQELFAQIKKQLARTEYSSFVLYNSLLSNPEIIWLTWDLSCIEQLRKLSLPYCIQQSKCVCIVERIRILSQHSLLDQVLFVELLKWFSGHAKLDSVRTCQSKEENFSQRFKPRIWYIEVSIITIKASQ